MRCNDIETIILKLNSSQIDEQDMKAAAEILQSGGLVAFPTETVYGLGGNALNPEASAQIYAAKGRPSDNPLIVHIASDVEVDKLAVNVSPKARLLMKHFWPGPLTLIFEKSQIVPHETTGGLNTVAIRMPSHPVALALIEQSGISIAAPSANLSGRPSPTRAEHVIEDLSGKIEMIIDGDDSQIGLESTIVDTTCEPPMILRPGYITKKSLETVIGEVVEDPTLYQGMDETTKPKAPGMKYKHYAPKADLIIYAGDLEKVTAHIKQLVASDIEQGRVPGILASEETRSQYDKGTVLSIGTRKEEESIAYHLYDVLREFDRLGVDVIYGESFPQDDLGQAIMNRLMKAAGYHIVNIS